MSPQEKCADQLYGGVGKADIVSGKEEHRVRDRLYARALVLREKETYLVLIVMDAVAIGGICDIEDRFVEELRGKIQEKWGIAGEQVWVSATHTHPPDALLCAHEKLLERTLSAVQEAMESLENICIGVGKTSETEVFMNRNLEMAGDVEGQWTVRHTNPCPPVEKVSGIGEVDTEVGVIRIDRADGRNLAVLYNFGCHLLFGDTGGRITANFPMVISGIVERNMGGDGMAFFIQGAAGDVIDKGFKDFTQVRDVEPYGMRLGLNILECARNIKMSRTDHSGSDALQVISTQIELPRRTDIPARREKLLLRQAELLEGLRFTALNFKSFLPLYLRQLMDPEYPGNDKFHYLHAETMGDKRLKEMDQVHAGNVKKYLANIQAMEELARIQDDLETFARHETINAESGSDFVDAQVQGIRIGEAVFITAPLELLTEIGLWVKRSSPHEHTFVAGFSNGYFHYAPPAEMYDQGGYEVTECLLAPEWQNAFESKVKEILEAL